VAKAIAPRFAPSHAKETTHASHLKAADDGVDGVVCVNAVASGNFIVPDDNNTTPSQPCAPGWYVHGGRPWPSLRSRLKLSR
jgi:hypothetical protein